MKSISIKLPEELERQIVQAACEQQVSKSCIMREALASYFAGEQKHNPKSCIGAISDLVGCLEGPQDLSYNKQYLEGFGA